MKNRACLIGQFFFADLVFFLKFFKHDGIVVPFFLALHVSSLNHPNHELRRCGSTENWQRV